MLYIIAAFDENFNIGKNNKIPWHFTEDLLYFKKRTENNVCIMGKNTWESLPKKYRPLPNRKNIVVSKTYKDNPDLLFTDKNSFELFSVASLNEAIIFSLNLFPNKDYYLIGGERIYREAILQNIVDGFIITHIKGTYDGDVKFPEIDFSSMNSNNIMENNDIKIVEYNYD